MKRGEYRREYSVFRIEFLRLRLLASSSGVSALTHKQDQTSKANSCHQLSMVFFGETQGLPASLCFWYTLNWPLACTVSRTESQQSSKRGCQQLPAIEQMKHNPDFQIWCLWARLGCGYICTNLSLVCFSLALWRARRSSLSQAVSRVTVSSLSLSRSPSL